MSDESPKSDGNRPMTGEQFIHLGAGIGFAAGVVLGATQDFIIGRAIYRVLRRRWSRRAALLGTDKWLGY